MMQHLFILTGASRGMGLAMAQQLLQPGHTLLCLSRHANEALATQAGGCGATLIQWSQDLADGITASVRLAEWLATLGCRRLCQRHADQQCRRDSAHRSARDADATDLAHALRVGLEAPMQLTATFLHATADWPGTRKVLNISSGLGRRAMASQAAYCAAKAGMDHFTRCVALDEALKRNGARVCSLAPGVIDTDMQRQLRGADGAAFPDQVSFASLKTSGQLTSPSDAAARVLACLARTDFGTHPVADVRD